MYYRDHVPAHFHAIYNEHEALIRIDDLTVIRGNLSPRVLGLVIEWAKRHKEELNKNWKFGQEHKPFVKIEPLE